jgi:hypothetical protein
MKHNNDNIRKLRELHKKYDKKTDLYLEELSRQSEGTTANSNIKEFVKLDKNGPLFFVSSKGFKRMYIDNKTKPHPSCLKYNYKKPTVLTSKTNTYDNFKPKRPIQSGEPCGFEGTFVGIKNTNGSTFTNIGYVNEDGELEEYLESKITDVTTCASSIIEINNDTWNAFLKSNNKRKTSPCEYNVDDSRKSLLRTENEMNSTLSELKPPIKKKLISNTQMYDTSNELHNQRKIFDTLTSRGATLNALSSVMDKYKAFFYQHLKWILFVILFILFGIYGVYRMIKTTVAHTIPDSWKNNFDNLKSKSKDMLFNQPETTIDTNNQEITNTNNIDDTETTSLELDTNNVDNVETPNVDINTDNVETPNVDTNNTNRSFLSTTLDTLNT